MTSSQKGTQVPVKQIRRRHSEQTFDRSHLLDVVAEQLPKRMKRSWMPDTISEKGPHKHGLRFDCMISTSRSHALKQTFV